MSDSQGSPTTAAYGHPVIYEDMLDGGGGVNSDACAHQIPPLYVDRRIPGQEKLQGDSQLDFQNYTPVPEIAGELAGVGSHRTRADANFSVSVHLICMNPLCFAVKPLPSSAENHGRVALRHPIHFNKFTFLIAVCEAAKRIEAKK